MDELVISVDWNATAPPEARGERAPAAQPARARTAGRNTKTFTEYVDETVNSLPDTNGLRTRTRRQIDDLEGKRRMIRVVTVHDSEVDKTIHANGDLRFTPAAGPMSQRQVSVPAKEEDIWRVLCDAARSAGQPLAPFNGRPMAEYCERLK